MAGDDSLRRTWGLAVGPSRARVLRGLGPASAPLPTSLVLRARQGHLRALMSGPAASWTLAAARLDLRADRRAFAAEIATLLEAHRLAGEFSRLAAAAPPPMLRLFDEVFPPGLRHCMVARLALDLTEAEEGALRLRLRRLVGAVPD